MSLTLYFVRFALLMNFIILAIWVCLTVFPFFDSPPSTFSWSIFKQEPAKDMLQGYGLDNTFLLYGEWGAMLPVAPSLERAGCHGQASRLCCCADPVPLQVPYVGWLAREATSGLSAAGMGCCLEQLAAAAQWLHPAEIET